MSVKSATGYRRVDRGKGHSYYGPDGAKLPGVTTVTGVIRNEAFTVAAADKVAAWAGDEKDTFAAMTPSAVTAAGKRFYRDHRFDAATRGQTIHAHAAQLLAGESVVIEEGDERIVDTFLRFADDYRLEPQALETMVVSTRWGYCGTLDYLGYIDHRNSALLDWKTGASGVWPETALQLAAYRYADLLVRDDGTEEPMPDVDLVGAVWLQDDRYDVIPVDASRDTFRTFLYCREVLRFTERERSDVVLEPLRRTA